MPRVSLLLFTIALALGGVSTTASSAIAAPAPTTAITAPTASAAAKRGTLKVVVTGLPKGERSSVRVQIPGAKERRLSATKRTTKLRLRPGALTVRAYPVKLQRRHGKVRRGSRTSPTAARQSVTVTAAGTTTVTVDYATVVNAAARRLRSVPLQVIGAPEQPQAIVVSTNGFTKGDVVIADPSPALPSGLRSKVVGVSRSGARTTLTLTPAQITDVLPKFVVDESALLKAAGSRAQRLEQDGSISLDFRKVFNCSVPLSAAFWEQLKLPGGGLRMVPDVSVDLSPWAKKEQRHVRLALTTFTDLGFGVGFIPKGASCGASVPIEVETNVGGFPVVFSLKVGLELGTGDHGFGFFVSVRPQLRQGFEWRDGKGTRVFGELSLTHQIDAGNSLRLSLPKIEAAMGLGTRDANIALGPTMSLDFSVDSERDPTCRIDWVEDQVARRKVTVGPVGIELPSQDPKVTNKHQSNCVPFAGPAKPQAWAFDPNGLGPVRIGMTRQQVEAAAGKKLVRMRDVPSNPCWQLEGAGEGAPTFAIDGPTLTSIQGGYGTAAGTDGNATIKGFKIGDTIARGIELHGPELVDTGYRIGQAAAAKITDPSTGNQLGVYTGGDETANAFVAGGLRESYCS